MSILVNKDTRLLVQGITGREGAFHTEQMIAYGTQRRGGRHARQGRRLGGRQRADLRYGARGG